MGQYSYVVSIIERNDNYNAEELHLCTGVLISNKFILTAAHCFGGLLLGEIRLIIGSVDLREGKKYDPSMWITYNQWADSKNITKKYEYNDIALIKLSDKVSGKVAMPASLSTKTTKNLRDQYVVLVGWGSTNKSPESPARYLHEVQIRVLPNEDCETIIYNLLNQRIAVFDKYVCTKAKPHALLAPGDSGGPVLRKNSVVAISRSTCPRRSLCDFPEDIVNDGLINLHTGIDFYREFISDVLKNY